MPITQGMKRTQHWESPVQLSGPPCLLCIDPLLLPAPCSLHCGARAIDERRVETAERKSFPELVSNVHTFAFVLAQGEVAC